MELFAFGDIPHRVTLRTVCKCQQIVGPLHPFPCGLSAQGGARVVAGGRWEGELASEVVVQLPSPQLPREGREEVSSIWTYLEHQQTSLEEEGMGSY